MEGESPPREGEAQSASRGARRRRRGLYGPPPRLTRSSPLTGRLLWHVGDWGRASEHIGQRWEEVAAETMRERLNSTSRLVVLMGEPELMAEVLGTGLPHADALRAWAVDAALGLEPLDFKWSLETASVRQVSAETLAHLLALNSPLLTAALSEARSALGLGLSAPVDLDDGRFVAPEHPANRAALRADPRLPSVLLPVEPQSFFRPLPGWPAAVAVGRIEGVDVERLRGVEPVERYYRLGAGVTGALTRLRTGLFEEETAVVDAPAEVAQMRGQGRAHSVQDLLLDLERQLAARRALDEQLAALPRSAYPFGRLRADLAKMGAARAVLESRGALGRAYADVTREASAAVRAAGRDLTRAGLDEGAALERLAAEPERWAAVARRRAAEIAPTLRPNGRHEPPAQETPAK